MSGWMMMDYLFIQSSVLTYHQICVSVVPLLLLFCLCGDAAAVGAFKAIPYDTKQQLISYHTEGQGEDKVL